MSRISRTVTPNLHDGLYDSEFSSGNASQSLQTIACSIRKVFCVDFYITYPFDPAARITSNDIRTAQFKRKSLGTISSHQTTSGTATVILNRQHHLALITCAHILDAKDTIISCFPPTGEDPYPYIKSISLREKQEIYVKDLPECGTFNILATDPEHDLAILGKHCEGTMDSIPVFEYPSGHATELGMGSLVYIIGYPMGNLMVTRGIVSTMNNRSAANFSVDALLNKGYSGGIILAIRDGLPNFELVGIIKSMSTRVYYYLKPEKGVYETHYNEFIPFTDPVYVGTEESVNYGINFVVPIETISEFYTKNRSALVAQGYNLDSFFKK